MEARFRAQLFCSLVLMDGGDSCSRPGVDNLAQSQTFHAMDDFQLVGAPLPFVAGDAAVPVKDGEPQAAAAAAAAVQVNTAAVGAAGQMMEKKKRGRPSKGQGQTPAPKPPPPKRSKEEEDVCFICFDGGSLVLCDRK